MFLALQENQDSWEWVCVLGSTLPKPNVMQDYFGALYPWTVRHARIEPLKQLDSRDSQLLQPDRMQLNGTNYGWGRSLNFRSNFSDSIKDVGVLCIKSVCNTVREVHGNEYFTNGAPIFNLHTL